MLDNFIKRGVHLTRRETLLLRTLMRDGEVLPVRFRDLGIADTPGDLSRLCKHLNNKFELAGIKCRVDCIRKRGQSYPHARRLVCDS